MAAWGDGDVFGGLLWDSDGGYGAGVPVCVVDGWESDVCGEYAVFLGNQSVEGEASGSGIEWFCGGYVYRCFEV